jgi:predicted alpha/beta hydrolase family esterase
LIGHSAGATLILGLLERIESPIKKAILVSGFHRYDENFKILQPDYNWEKIKNNCRKILFLNSDNDPFGCDDTEGREMFDKLGGIQIIFHGEGHMGSSSYNQPYKEFPFLLSLCEDF